MTVDHETVSLPLSGGWACDAHSKMGVPVYPPEPEVCPVCGHAIVYRVKEISPQLDGRIIMLGERLCISAWNQINVGGGCHYGDTGSRGMLTALGKQTDLVCLLPED